METAQLLILKAFILLLTVQLPGHTDLEKQGAINDALAYVQQAQEIINTPTSTPQIATPLPPPQAPIVQTPPPVVQAQNTVDLGAVPQESCTLQVIQKLDMDRTGDYRWTSTRVPTSTKGQIYYGVTMHFGDAPTQFQWKPIGNPLETSQGSYLMSYQSIPGNFAPTFDRQEKFKLELDNAECETTFTPQ